jgi:hypothetical protein
MGPTRVRLAIAGFIVASAVSSLGCGDTGPGGAPDASVDVASENVIHYLDAVATVPDAVAEEPAEGDASVALNCSPIDAGAPPPFVPPRAPRSACTDAQIQALYSDCFAGTAAACDAFKGDPNNSPCVLCMETSSSDLAWGTIVEFPNEAPTQANVGGCIALLDQDASPGSCGVSRQAYDLCRHDSCVATCPNGSTTAGLQAFNQCETLAQTTECAPYALAAQCSQSARYTPCLFADFQSYVLGLGRIFCEAGRDAGLPADAASDGPAE